jgi:PAS domain-containing protein
VFAVGQYNPADRDLVHFSDACKDGMEVVVESRMQLFDDGIVLEANRDITERREIEVALGESELRLRWLASIVEASDDAIVSKNLDGIITSWNEGAARLRLLSRRGNRPAHYARDP